MPEPTDNTETTEKGKAIPGPLEDPLAAPATAESIVDPDFCFDDANVIVKVGVSHLGTHSCS